METENNESSISTLMISEQTNLFFDDENSTNEFSPISFEMQIYKSIPQIHKHSLSNPLYQKENPLVWWNNNIKTFPHHIKQARKYLSIPATSVPSERLFSDAGNIITEKRNRLSSDIVHDILFLKHNSKLFNVYPGLEL
ncbi:7476_t:CDS:1 [Ambispora gerdemannii]|uniref:7476_t:CDS:1 n=1 Tax=Ambispora gerdemannii TaxID=144530 RepID=A0A9N9BYL9_9GLOM|nr:7476_t:CDS:1 [Ambispora gerdemannii]